MATRRTFLRGLGFGAMVAAAWPARRAFALEEVTYHSASWHPSSSAGFKILEVFCQGGLSHEETLWMASSDRDLYYSSDASWKNDASEWAEFSAPRWADIDASLESPMFPFRSSLDSSTGQYLSRIFSPFTDFHWGGGPYGSLTTLSSRMRVVALGHDQPPHTAAVPHALSGLTLGRPRRAGLGSAIEALYGDQNTPESPQSYVLYERAGLESALHAAAYGQHGAWTMPVLLEFSDDSSANDFRTNFDQHRGESADALWAHYQQQYAGQLTHGTTGSSRSAGHDAYTAASARLAAGASLSAKWANVDFQVQDTGFGGSTDNGTANPTRSMLRGAATLLSATTDGGAGARYVCVVDSGVGPDYDMHEATDSAESGESLATLQAGSLWSTVDQLATLINDGSIDLDDTVVVINTEFGRFTRGAQNGHYGSDHRPGGYAVAVLGGPIGRTGSAGVGGSLSNGDAVSDHDASKSYTPADLRAALLLSAGVDPFDADCFTTDETTLTTDADLASVFLGV